MARMRMALFVAGVSAVAINAAVLTSQRSERTLAGTVVDAYGAPVEGAHVEVVSQRGEAGRTRAKTAADGRFRLSLRDAGTVTVNAALPGFRESSLRVDANEAGQAAIVLMLVLGDMEGVTPSAITGRVLDANRQPVARAVVTISGLAGAAVTPSSTVADDQGTFAIDGSREAPYLVSAFVDGQYGVAVSPISTRGARAPVTVTMTSLRP
jgi:Carboxypeptidase regulatory-like domain